jgi:hypothetical protein
MSGIVKPFKPRGPVYGAANGPIVGRAKRPIIFIAMPTMDGRVNLGIHGWLFETLMRSLVGDLPWEFALQHINQVAPVEYARNVLTGMFLKREDCDRMFFMDHDMIPDQTAYQLFAETEADIVVGRALIFDAKTETTPPTMKFSAFLHDDKDELFHSLIPAPGEASREVDGAGTACMVIKRKVLEDRRMWGETKYKNLLGQDCDLELEQADPMWAPPIFRRITTPSGRTQRGEDLDFCRRARLLGYSVKVIWGAGFGHLKEVNLENVMELCHNAVQAYRQAGGDLEKTDEAAGG